MKRETIIAGNWKMNTTPEEGTKLLRAIGSQLTAIKTDVSGVVVVVCPPATHLITLKSAAAAVEEKFGVYIEIGAQNVHWEDSGAFTGEVSAPMLKNAGCGWVIIGHSERRRYFGETDRTANARLQRALKTRLRPIFCVGERIEERNSGAAFDVLKRQIEVGMDGVPAERRQGIVIAYEPVWAIGTGLTATPEQAEEAHSFIRSTLSAMWDEETAMAIVIQYGGSVNDKNAADLLRCPNVDGALVGGASLDAGKFAAIVEAAAASRLSINP